MNAVVTIIYLIILVLVIAGMWMMFQKAGKPGWYSIIPILNTVALVNIAGKPWWWILLLFIPLVNLVIIFMIWNSISEAFGYGIGMTLGLFFLSFIFIPVLGFGSATYTRPNTGVPA